MENLWDVYIWPINNPSIVTCVAKGISHEKAVEMYNRYLNGTYYDPYMVPAGTKLYI